MGRLSRPSLIAAAICTILSAFNMVGQLDDGGWPLGDAAAMEQAVAIAYAGSDDGVVARLPVCRWALGRLAKLFQCIDASIFATDYQGKRPVVISGLLHAAERARWTHEALLAEHGRNAPLAMSIGGAVAINEGGGGSVLIPLGEVVDKLLPDPRLFIFDTTSALPQRLASDCDLIAICLRSACDLLAICLRSACDLIAI